MPKLLDHYSEFRRRIHTCKHCGWTGSGAAMKNGECFEHGIAKHCPECGERYAFAQFSVVVVDDAPEDWPSKVPPVGD